jgi:hypothetical protein
MARVARFTELKERGMAVVRVGVRAGPIMMYLTPEEA